MNASEHLVRSIEKQNSFYSFNFFRSFYFSAGFFRCQNQELRCVQR